MKTIKFGKVICLIILLLMISVSVVLAEDRPLNTWVPSSGQVGAWDSSNFPNTVFLYCDFQWSSLSRLSGLRADYNETLEMDIVFKNFGGQSAYAYWWYNYDYHNPNANRGTYWETNQPWPYWDTQLDDGPTERPFTVGCSDANVFQPNTLYYWWAYAVKNSSGSSAKLVAQRGYRAPDWALMDPYAVFAEQSYKVFEFTDWTAPGTKSWTF